MSSPGFPDLEARLGKERVEEEVLSLGQAQGLAAMLDRDAASLKNGGILPAGWHWIYFNSVAPRSTLAPDGHQERGSFLPPIALPRRMWAGGRLRFPGVLRIGEEVRRVSTIQSIRHKEGRSGPLVFVTLRHQISNQDGVALEEEQNLVFRTESRTDGGQPRAPEGRAQPPTSPAAEPEWTESFVADEVALFRFSALTSNSHRIHYDHGYATGVEGYPGLVVHGPLLALLLLDAGIRHSGGEASIHEPPKEFRYRALRPLFCNEEFHLSGVRADNEGEGLDTQPGSGGVMKLWAAHPERGVATEAELEVDGTA